MYMSYIEIMYVILERVLNNVQWHEVNFVSDAKDTYSTVKIKELYNIDLEANNRIRP